MGKKRGPTTAITGDDAAPCFICKKSVKDGDSTALQCGVCHEWAHQRCLSVPDSVVKFFQSEAYENANFGFPLLCPLCMPVLDHLVDIDKRLNAIEANFEARLLALEATAPAGAPSNSHGHSDCLPTLDEQRMLLKDELERESKRKNAVLFGLPVTDENDTDVVKKMVADAKLANLQPQDVVTVFRDGPKVEHFPRFCKVYLSSVNCKTAFIDMINTNRKQNVTDFASLRARPDLSFLQRKRARELRDELKTRVDAGETDIFIDYRADCIRKRGPLARPRRVI